MDLVQQIPLAPQAPGQLRPEVRLVSMAPIRYTEQEHSFSKGTP